MELVEDGEETGFWLVVLGSEAPGEHQSGKGHKLGREGTWNLTQSMEAEAVLSLQSNGLLTCC